ncbi:MAG: hypothetical protein HC857_13055 [Synechococcales cyanobacterium RU_4_20]|nr:hypothetical protein [Synechococcales cyanobacterium RU_4_20]
MNSGQNPTTNVQSGSVSVLAQGALEVGEINTAAAANGTLTTAQTLIQAGNITLESKTGAVGAANLRAEAVAQTAPYAGTVQAQGGEIAIRAAMTATLGQINSAVSTNNGRSNSARAGGVTVVGDAIATGNITTSARVNSVLSSDSIAVGGRIQLTSAGDLKAGELNSGASQIAGLRSQATAGEVVITALGTALGNPGSVEIQQIDASAESQVALGNGSVSGGQISIVTAESSVKTGNLSSQSRGLASGSLTARAGNISIRKTDAGSAQLVTGELDASVRLGAGGAGSQLDGGQVRVESGGGTVQVGAVKTSVQSEGAAARAIAGSINLSALSADDAVLEVSPVVEFSSLDASASVRIPTTPGLVGDPVLLQPGAAQAGAIQVRSEGTIQGIGRVRDRTGQPTGATIQAQQELNFASQALLTVNPDVLLEQISTALTQLSRENLAQFFGSTLGTGAAASDPAANTPAPEAASSIALGELRDRPGQITLQHRGGTANWDFVVGQASSNGTLGSIRSGTSILSTGQFPVLPQGGVAIATPQRKFKLFQ